MKETIKIIKKNLLKNKFVKILQNKYLKIKFKYIRLKDKLRIEKYSYVYFKKERIFSILDMGHETRMRALSFETKEPETINWINNFDKDDCLLDIGANVGLYSLYAAYRKHSVISIEPDALNYALLNLNIRANNFSNYITPYSVAMHDKTKFSKFNISSYVWGGALNSFDNNIDFENKKFIPIHFQGVFGISLDKFLKMINVFPNHIKIDVDGNERLILEGAKDTLSNLNVKSLLVELNEKNLDYESTLDFIFTKGFTLVEKTHAEKYNQGKFSSLFNHIFKRVQ